MATIVNTRDVELQATSPRVTSVTMADNIQVSQDNVQGLGLVVEGTKQVILAATSQIFQIPKSGSTSPTSITLTAQTKNISATPTLTIDSGGGTMNIPVTLTSGAFTFSEANMTTDTVRFLLSATESSNTYTDKMTIVKAREGIDSLNGLLTNESHTLPADYLGNVLSYAGASGQFKVFQGINDVTSVCTFALVSGGNPDGLTFSLTASGASAGNYSVTGGYPTGVNLTTLTFRATFGSKTIDKVFTISKAKQGQDGTTGSNAATVLLFQRTASASAPSLPSANVTYTFATGVATGMNNGWTQTMPASGGAYRWMTTASALGTGTTDVIPSSEWAAASNVSQDGTDGLNSALVYIYQRSASAPTLPSATTTYTFATGNLTGLNNGWARTIPAGTNPIYVSVATAVSANATDTIAAGEWATAVVLAQNGSNGTNGTDGNDGQRGSKTFYVALSGSSATWSNSLATTAASEGGGPIIRDIVTEYNESQGYSETRFWDGTAWLVINAVVDGNLLVTGTVTGDKLLANTVTAAKIDSRNLTIKDSTGTVIFSAGSIPGTDSASVMGFNPRYTNWTSTLPTGWTAWSGNSPVKETTIVLASPYSTKYTTVAATNQGMYSDMSFVDQPLPAGTFVQGTFNFHIGNWVGGGRPGYLVRLFTSSDLTTYVDTQVQCPSTAETTWQNAPFIAGAGGASIYMIRIYQMASWTSFSGGSASAGNIVYFGPFTFEVRNRMTASNIATFMQSATIGTAQIVDLSVSTLKIADQAVTFPSSVFSTGSVTIPQNVETTLQTITFTSTGAPVAILAGAEISADFTAGSNFYVSLDRDNTTLLVFSNLSISSSATASIVLPPVFDNPSAGSHTYRLKVTRVSQGGIGRNRGMFILETKK